MTSGLEDTRSAQLATLVDQLLPGNAFYRAKLERAGVDAGALRLLPLDDALARLPFTTKLELQEDQARQPPFGTNLTFPLSEYRRVHRTSGTSGRSLWWLDTAESWRGILEIWSEVYEAAGVTALDRVFFPFSFGPFIGFWAAFEGAVDRGALAIPGGGLSTPARLAMLLEAGATVVCATPTYALHMAETARQDGNDLASSAVRAVIVAGEPGGSLPEVRRRIEAAWGARVFDHCGMTEVGPVGYECREQPGGMHLSTRGHIAEVVDPVTGARRDRPGDGPFEGELVLTTLLRPGSPLLRYRTGDLVRLSRRSCPCGRSGPRLEGGILGRVDDLLFIRGNNVYPAAIEAAVQRVEGVGEYRIRALGRGELNALEVEVEPRGDGGSVAAASELRERVAREIERSFFFRADVRLAPPGTLPRFELKGRRFIRETGP